MLKDYTMTPNRAGIPVWRPAQPVIGREDEHQTALTNWARMMRTQYPALTLYHHIPNGGLRDKRTAARLIGQGVLIGVPDVFIPAARGDYHGIYVELKVGHNRPTPAQNEFMSAAIREGYYCCVCYGWPCAAAVIEDYLRMPASDWQDTQEDPKPLTLEELRQMNGEPVWIVEHPDWGHWELAEDAEDYLMDRDEDFYGMKHNDPFGRFGLHVLGWLAYRHKPKEETK